jgi:hypothetical protein
VNGRICSAKDELASGKEKQSDPENHQSLEETNLSTPMNARVYVNIPEGRHVLWLDFVLVKIMERAFFL